MKIINENELLNNSGFFNVIEYENMPEIDKIIKDVKIGGDTCLMELSKRFCDGDFNCPNDFLVSDKEIKDAYNSVGKDFIEKISIAKNNIEFFSMKQLETVKNLDLQVGNSFLGHKIVSLNKILAYVPGGNYPLPSSALMTVVPAKVAGVKEVVLTSPKIKPETIVAADIAGADKIYKLGGAQAISAFAYGTENISAVDKIVGPGNRFVTYAKKNVYGTVDIDFLAGPSEVLIIADDSANPKLIAADMLAQAEHDKDARAYLITNSINLANMVEKCAQEFLQTLSTANIAKLSFENSYAVITTSIQSTIEIANKRAPEHLEIMVKDEKPYLNGLKNYGSLFIGENCAEVFGDYVSGTNHVLPTNSAAKYTGGLSVFDFIKILTYQKIDKSFAVELSKTASYIAHKEGLMAHKLASDLRGLN